jgi:hypothetical protein
VNRRQRREAARRAAKSLHLHGTEKAQTVRAIAAQLRGVVLDQPQETQEPVAEHGSAEILRRKSGLFSVKRKGLLEP